jgi:hypothetical protein
MHELSNEDVTWTATFDGYAPVLSQRALCATAQSAPMSALLELLDDPRTFVIAHVLLTARSAEPYATFPEWNGLQIRVAADGQVTIDPDQRARIAARWRSGTDGSH